MFVNTETQGDILSPLTTHDKFLWGVATSAFQLEGLPYADWTLWDEILSDKPDITNHYELYKDDLDLLKDLGVNAYRFSLEWSRIQPREKVWDDKAIAHYQEIIDILLSNNIEPMLTQITIPGCTMRFNPFRKMGVEMRHRDIEGYGLTDMGWEIHPYGLERVLRYASKLNVPLIITENGIATRDSQTKIKYMKRHVDVVESGGDKNKNGMIFEITKEVIK